MHWMRMGLGVRAGHQKWLNHFESAILFVHNYCVRICVWGVWVECAVHAVIRASVTESYK